MEDLGPREGDEDGGGAAGAAGPPAYNGDWLTGQNRAFRAALDGAPLAESLGILAGSACREIGGEVRCAVYMADPDGKTLHHVVGMPESYAKKVDGCAIGADSLACGLAAGQQRPVITPDVREEPR
jgi:hypothetical protein